MADIGIHAQIWKTVEVNPPIFYHMAISYSMQAACTIVNYPIQKGLYAQFEKDDKLMDLLSALLLLIEYMTNVCC